MRRKDSHESRVIGCFKGNMCVFGGMYSRAFSWKVGEYFIALTGVQQWYCFRLQ